MQIPTYHYRNQWDTNSVVTCLCEPVQRKTQTVPDKKNHELQPAVTVKAGVLHTLTVIKAISHFSNVFFLAPAISTFTTSIKICLLFPFHPQWLEENKTKQTKKKQPNLIICKAYCSLHMMRSFWGSCSSLQAEDFKKEVGSSSDPSRFSLYTFFFKQFLFR